MEVSKQLWSESLLSSGSPERPCARAQGFFSWPVRAKAAACGAGWASAHGPIARRGASSGGRATSALAERLLEKMRKPKVS
jgi:hypothetical protein